MCRAQTTSGSNGSAIRRETGGDGRRPPRTPDHTQLVDNGSHSIATNSCTVNNTNTTLVVKYIPGWARYLKKVSKYKKQVTFIINI